MNYYLKVACGLTVILLAYHFWFKPPETIPPIAHSNGQIKKILEISLTDSLVGQMEKDWNELPQQAEAKRESRGWRMTRVNSNSLFAQAGLQEGDLVTSEFLNKLQTSDMQIKLMLRVQQILNRITR